MKLRTELVATVKLPRRPEGQQSWAVSLHVVKCRRPLELGASKTILIYSATPDGIRALVKKLAPRVEPAWAVGYSGYERRRW